MSDGQVKGDKLMKPRYVPDLPPANNPAAIRLLREWMSDDCGYDEEVWPRVKKSMEENSFSSRKPFHD